MRLAILAMVIAAAPANAQQPATKFSGNTPISVSGLVDRSGCYPARLSGRVVKRSFDPNGIVLQSVTIEEGTGERSYINIDSSRIDAANMADRANAIRAMQIILREGGKVRLGIFACGAAGRVMMLESAASLR